MFINFFENRTVYEIMWKNFVDQSKPQMTIWRMRIACWIPKTTNTHRGCVILITFPLQQWLHERTSLLGCTYISCLVVLNFNSKENWPCHDSGNYVLASHCRWPDLISGLSICDSLQKTWPRDRVFTEYMCVVLSVLFYQPSVLMHSYTTYVILS